MDLRLLFTTHAEPSCLPRQIVDPSEILAGPNYNKVLRHDGSIHCLGTPHGVWSMSELLKNVPRNEWPAVILVHADATMGCAPGDFPAGIPKILLVGGATHILKSPLTKLLSYASQMKFNGVVCWNRHNAHWFRELGLPTFWMPGLLFGIPEVQQAEARKRMISFFGQIGQYHPRRNKLIDGLKQSGLPFVAGPMPRTMGLELYAQSLLVFNGALNAELNLRVFEGTSQGAAVISERLTPHAGQEHFFKDGESIIGYSSPDELLSKARYYLDHPQEALEIGQRGREVYERYFTSAARREAFFALVEGRDATSPFALRDEPRCNYAQVARSQGIALKERVSLYEWVQEQHRILPEVKIDILGIPDPLHISDISDLNHLDVARVQTPHLEVPEWETLIRTLGGQLGPIVEQPRSGSDLLLASPSEILQRLRSSPELIANYRAIHLSGDVEKAGLVGNALEKAGFTAGPNCSRLYQRAEA